MSQALQRVVQRSLSLGAAAVLTLAMLGGIHQLSQPEDGVLQWAQQSSVQA